MTYKVVFQGGGAKLFPLIAAVEALQIQSKSDNDFSLDTVAGASAGSIAAMLLAAGINCDELKRYFKTDEGNNEVLRAFPQLNQLAVLKCVLLGKTIYDRNKLEKLLYKILSLGGHNNKKDVVRLQPSIKIAITDLKQSKIEFIELSECTVEELVRNVADSCSIPFIFKNHKSKANWEFVDGGLFENFPVSSIMSTIDESRKILGFSFAEENKEAQDQNPKLLGYMKILVSTAVDANIEASLRLLGDENIFAIKSDISTLDFSKGLEQFVAMDGRFDSLKSNVQSWIEDIVRREREIDATIAASDRSLVPTSFLNFKKSIGILYEKRRSPKLAAKSSISYMQINSIFGDFSPNKNRFEYLYRKVNYPIPDDGVECIISGTVYDTTIDVEKYSDFTVLDDNGHPIDFLVLPMAADGIPRV